MHYDSETWKHRPDVFKFEPIFILVICWRKHPWIVSLHFDSLLMEFWSLYLGCYQPNGVFSIFNVLLKIAWYCPFNTMNFQTIQTNKKFGNLKDWKHKQLKWLFISLFVVLAPIHYNFCMWHWIFIQEMLHECFIHCFARGTLGVLNTATPQKNMTNTALSQKNRQIPQYRKTSKILSKKVIKEV